MSNNRNEILDRFFKDNPELSDPQNHHRKLADWSFDTRFRPQVDAGTMDFEAAINAAKAEAYKILPRPGQSKDVTQINDAVRELAELRNQEPPRFDDATARSTFVERATDEPDDSVERANAAIREMAATRSQEIPQGSRTKPHANFI